MKKTFLSFTLVACFSLPGLAAGPFYNPKPLVDSIQLAIEKAVGASDSDRILGGYSYENPVQNTDPFQAGGIECPKNISGVKQAVDLVMANLQSTFTNQIISSLNGQTNMPGGDTLLQIAIGDVPQNSQVGQVQRTNLNRTHGSVTVRISVFKRSSGRVIILPNYISGFPGGVG